MVGVYGEGGEPMTEKERKLGRFTVRIPVDLHRHLIDRAEKEGVTLNQLLVALLAGRSGWEG